MGYKSDVRISLSINGVQELSNYVDDFFEKNNVDEQYNILHCMDVSHRSKDTVYCGWNDIKWYETQPEIMAIVLGIEHLKKNEYSTRFIRIGQEYDDIYQCFTDGNKDKNIDVEYPSMIRRFDDSYVFRCMDKTHDQER